jgi:pilus assembly protein CpaF
MEAPKDEMFFEIKRKVHTRIIEEINLAALNDLQPDEIRPEVGEVVRHFLAEEKVLLNEEERVALISEIVDELMGFGPLQHLLNDPTVSDILVNTYKDIYVERFGKLEKTNTRFADDNHLRNIIDRIISPIGRRIDESSPMVDARLPDGSRVNAIIPPLAIDGPMVSIRRFAVNPLQMTDSGKTTLLNVLSGFIPENERVVTIEDSAELKLQQEHVVRLETRPPSIEGTGAITQRDLVRNSLRMRPDRIIIGEVRADEVFDMLQAMNTGHDGSMTTIHANSARDSLTRLEAMILMSGINLPENALRFMISSALDIIVQATRFPDGTRKLISISEVVGMEGNIITLQDIFVFERQGIDPDGNVIGHFRATGIRPKFADKIELAGIKIEQDLFLPERNYN